MTDPIPLLYALPDLPRISWLQRQRRKPIGWPTHLATLFISSGCIVVSMNYCQPFWTVFFGGPVLVVWWIIRATGYFTLAREHRSAEPLASRRCWLVLPALAAFAALLIAFNWPERALFAMHRSELERLARLAAASPTPITWTRSVGLYGTVTITQLEPGLIGISVPGQGLTGIDGYVFEVDDQTPPHNINDGWVQGQIAPHWFCWIRASF